MTARRILRRTSPHGRRLQKIPAPEAHRHRNTSQRRSPSRPARRRAFRTYSNRPKAAPWRQGQPAGEYCGVKGLEPGTRHRLRCYPLAGGQGLTGDERRQGLHRPLCAGRQGRACVPKGACDQTKSERITEPKPGAKLIWHSEVSIVVELLQPPQFHAFSMNLSWTFLGNSVKSQPVVRPHDRFVS